MTIWTFERTTGKTGTICVILAKIDGGFQVILAFTLFFAIVSAKNLQTENSCFTK